jgi:TPR repeat protein
MLGKRAWSKRLDCDRARLNLEIAAQKAMSVHYVLLLFSTQSNGYGVEQDYDKVDYDKARELSEQAAGHGHADSQFRLGYLY